MAIVDEDGRLFGVVNVIDLLVAAVVLVTLASGAVFVLTDEPEPTQERYLTVVLDDRPGGAVPTLDTGTVTPPDGRVDLGPVEGRVTDRYVAPGVDGGFVTVARIRVNVSEPVASRTTDRRLVTEQETYIVGDRVSLSAGDRFYRGSVHAVGRSGDELPVRTVETTVVTRLPPPVADRIQPGDTQRVAGQEIARVTTVDREQTGDDRTRVALTVALRVLETDETTLYGSQSLRPGAEIRVTPDEYEFTATVTGGP